MSLRETYLSRGNEARVGNFISDNFLMTKSNSRIKFYYSEKRTITHLRQNRIVKKFPDHHFGDGKGGHARCGGNEIGGDRVRIRW